MNAPLEQTHEERDYDKVRTIIINGTPHEWREDVITYAQVVTLEVPDYPQHPEITYLVKYKNGHGNKPEGILSPGASVKVKEGMIFSVSESGQS
jgi:Xaa-Pro aminopeptidase